MTNSLYSNQNRVHGGYYSKPSLAWALFGFWLNYIARYAQSLKSKKSLQPSDPRGSQIFEMGSKIINYLIN